MNVCPSDVIDAASGVETLTDEYVLVDVDGCLAMFMYVCVF